MHYARIARPYSSRLRREYSVVSDDVVMRMSSETRCIGTWRATKLMDSGEVAPVIPGTGLLYSLFGCLGIIV